MLRDLLLSIRATLARMDSDDFFGFLLMIIILSGLWTFAVTGEIPLGNPDAIEMGLQR